MINAINLNKHITYIYARSKILITTNCALNYIANYRKKERKKKVVHVHTLWR